MPRSGMALSLFVTVAVLLTPAALAQQSEAPLLAGSWLLKGNAAAAGNFLGTTDNAPLIFRADGKEAMRIVPGGQIGIGTSAPNSRLTVTETDPGAGNGIYASTVDNSGAGLFGSGAGRADELVHLIPRPCSVFGSRNSATCLSSSSI